MTIEVTFAHGKSDDFAGFENVEKDSIKEENGVLTFTHKTPNGQKCVQCINLNNANYVTIVLDDEDEDEDE